jgi:hypothetical protein
MMNFSDNCAILSNNGNRDRNRGMLCLLTVRKEKMLIRYMGTRNKDDGSKVYVFVVNGQQKEVKEANLKQHPGCYEALPSSVKDQIAKNRAWLSRI